MVQVRIAPSARRSSGHNHPIFDVTQVAPITSEERSALLYVARQSLLWMLDRHTVPQWQTDSSTLLTPRAVFVTLREQASGALRGCRGECVAVRPLIEAVARMSVAAALDDPRFPPVCRDEVPGLCIEINALTPPTPIAPSDIEVGRHGLMIVRGRQLGLLLPEVPIDFGWNCAEYLRALCGKAGLPGDAWQDSDARLYGFETEAWSEESTD